MEFIDALIDYELRLMNAAAGFDCIWLTRRNAAAVQKAIAKVDMDMPSAANKQNTASSITKYT